MTRFRRVRWTLSLASLIAVNLAPLVGVIAFGWDARFVVLLYWFENLVIGGYAVLRIAFARAPLGAFHLGKLFAIPFFALHFGGFCAVHGLFVVTFFKIGGGGFPTTSSSGFLVFFELLGAVLRTVWNSRPPGMEWPLLGLVVSHGVSFVQNYLLGGEREAMTVGKLMAQPYKRIAVLHVAILAGGVPVLLLDSPIGLVVVLVLLKTVMDVLLHTREHRHSTPA